MTYERLMAEMDSAVRIPGVTNAWTMPIQGRIDMLATGIRTPVGIKLFGPIWPSWSASAARLRLPCERSPAPEAPSPSARYPGTTWTSTLIGLRLHATASTWVMSKP